MQIIPFYVRKKSVFSVGISEKQTLEDSQVFQFLLFQLILTMFMETLIVLWQSLVVIMEGMLNGWRIFPTGFPAWLFDCIFA